MLGQILWELNPSRAIAEAPQVNEIASGTNVTVMHRTPMEAHGVLTCFLSRLLEHDQVTTHSKMMQRLIPSSRKAWLQKVT